MIFKLMTASLAALMAAAALAAQTQPAATAEEEVLDTLRAVDEAAEKRDRAAMEHLTADEYIFHASTGISQNKKQAIEETMAGGSTWPVQKYDDLNDRIYGDVAIVTGTYLITGISDTYRPGPRLITRIFVRREGRWQDLGGQATLVPLE